MSRNALVTGANRGIGLELTRQLLARGERVIATCRLPGKATELNALAGQFPGRLQVLPLDVANDKSRAQLLADVALVLGADERLDLLINNAGVLHSGERFGQVHAATLEDSLRTNAIGPFLLAQALVPWLRTNSTVGVGESGGAIGAARSGGPGGTVKSLPDTRLVDCPPGASAALPHAAVIANLSSQLGSIAGVSRFGAPSYAISKAAQNMATRQLAQAVAARGIVVLALHPGWAQTAMGGPKATDATADVVAGLLGVIAAATPAHSGGFFDWRGQSLDW